MIRKFFTAFSIISFFCIAHSSFASLATITNKASFEPVEWYTTLEEGGFSIVNQTSKTQYVQVVVNSGRVGTTKIVGNKMSCQADLLAKSSHAATICELAPKEKLIVDIDMASGMNASGTYQIEMQRS